MRVVHTLVLFLACAEEPLPDTGDEGPPTVEFGLTTRPANERCMAVARPPTGADVTFTRIWPTIPFDAPVGMIHPPADDTAWFVIEQTGALRRVAGGSAATDSAVALDISDRISAWRTNEDGFLGAAFHPSFADNGYLYVNYTTGTETAGRSVVSRFRSSDGGLSFDLDSETILLEVDQPYTNHNGGHLSFGPDGYLYIGFGDGGAGGDPQGYAQNPDALLGKMLRVDVDAGAPYAIPSDNPFAAGGGAPEIYALGLRNPWRYSFDRESGALWVGDVGQDEWEEIDRVELGGNYGWNVKEGAHCSEGQTCDGPYLDPVVEYPHTEGDSVTGGVVYRGAAIPSLSGVYLYADAYRAKVWGLFHDETGSAAPELLSSFPGYPVHFAEDVAGEVYIVDYLGTIVRLDPAGDPPIDTFPRLLSETGCVDPSDPTQAAPGMIPYGVNYPFWSDGAAKQRWFAIPDGTTLSVREDGSFDWPVGSVTMKTFSIGGRRVETRLMMLHDDGNWAGYSYEWDAIGSDAELLAADKTVEVAGRTWSYPSRAECLQCHTAAAGRVLGPRIEQLNGDFVYPRGRANQVRTLDHIGLFAVSPGAPEGLVALPTLGGDAPVEDEARAYLASNCAMCHLPDGTGGGAMDFRYATPFAEARMCQEAPINGDLGVAGAAVFSPGDPDRSVLSLRMRTLGAQRMPPLSSHVVDDGGVATIDAWIAGVAACP